MASNWVFGAIGAGAILQQNFGVVSYFIPPQFQAPALAALAVVGVIGRLIRQPSVDVLPADSGAETEHN